MKDHIIKKNKTQYLDEYVVDFLDNRRRESPIILMQMDKDKEIQRLSNENKAFLMKIAELQGALLQENDSVELLQ